jgi:hypothetical protein
MPYLYDKWNVILIFLKLNTIHYGIKEGVLMYEIIKIINVEIKWK